MDLCSFSICVTACPACVGSKTMPEPNCALANGCNAANPTASTVRVSFFICLIPFVAVGLVLLYSGTVLLLCSENLLLELRETVGLWLAPCLAFFLLSF